MATAIGAPTRSSSGSEKWSHVVQWLQPEGPPGHAGAGCTFYLFIRAQPNLISLRSAGTMLASFRRSLTPWRTLVEAQFESKLRASRRPRRTWTRTC